MVVKGLMWEASRLCHRQKFHSLESQGRDLHPLQESGGPGSEDRPGGSGRCCLHPRGTVVPHLSAWMVEGWDGGGGVKEEPTLS